MDKPDIWVVYKTSARKNAKTQLIVFKNTFVDDIIDDKKRKPLLPKGSEILDIGVGSGFDKKYKKKYKF